MISFQRLHELRNAMNRDIEKLEKLQCRAESIGVQLSGMPHGGGDGDKIGRLSTEIVYMQQVVQIDAVAVKSEIIRLSKRIAFVQDKTTRRAIALHYIGNKTWEQVADVVGSKSGTAIRKRCSKTLRQT